MKQLWWMSVTHIDLSPFSINSMAGECLIQCEKMFQMFCFFLTRGQFWSSGIFIACVCVCVRLFVCQSWACPLDNSWPVQTRITKFGPKVHNTLVKVPMVLWQMTLTFKVNFHLKVKFYPILSFKFVHVITHHLFKQGSPNLDQKCKTHWLRFLWFCGEGP